MTELLVVFFAVALVSFALGVATCLTLVRASLGERRGGYIAGRQP